jgi:hypothetical protein
MDGLLKEKAGSQLFTVFGQPRTRLRGPDKAGETMLEMEGVDICNPVDNSVSPSGRGQGHRPSRQRGDAGARCTGNGGRAET